MPQIPFKCEGLDLAGNSVKLVKVEADSVVTNTFQTNRLQASLVEVSEAGWMTTAGGKSKGHMEFDPGKGTVLRSPDGTRFLLAVANSGALGTLRLDP